MVRQRMGSQKRAEREKGLGDGRGESGSGEEKRENRAGTQKREMGGGERLALKRKTTG